MFFSKKLIIFILLVVGTSVAIKTAYGQAGQSAHKGKHFDKILVVVFENMSYSEIKNEPSFKKLITYTAHDITNKGKLISLGHAPLQDAAGNGYAFFSQYYNNHSGGVFPTRTSQPNYIALTSGSVHNIFDNENHDLDVDNLAKELIDAGINWKVYAEDLPDPGSEQAKPGDCFTQASYPSKDGYQRKHEPFISYVNIQTNHAYCKNIVNSTHLVEDLNAMPEVAFYIPNQINDGHNGTLEERTANANAFLSRMLGADPKTGELLPNANQAPLQRFMAQGGLLVITFDEPSTTGNVDPTIFTVLAGKMINSGAYPDQQGQHLPVCFPEKSEQRSPQDQFGLYDTTHCNHYNLLRLVEINWGLRGLNKKDISAGYKYSLPLDHSIPELWR